MWFIPKNSIDAFEPRSMCHGGGGGGQSSGKGGAVDFMERGDPISNAIGAPQPLNIHDIVTGDNMGTVQGMLIGNDASKHLGMGPSDPSQPS